MDELYVKGVLIGEFCKIALPEYIKANPQSESLSIARRTLNVAVALADALFEYANEQEGGAQ